MNRSSCLEFAPLTSFRKSVTKSRGCIMVETCPDCVSGGEIVMGLILGIVCLSSWVYAVRWWGWKQHERMLEEWRLMILEKQAQRAAEAWERAQKKLQKDE